MTTTTIAGAAGRITGTAVRGLIWAHQTIDWAEVRAIVLRGLQLLIVLTLLAGRITRRAWDALPELSAAMGSAYARIIVPVTKAIQSAPMVHPLAELGQQLEALTTRELQAMTGTRRKLAKAALIGLVIAG